MNRIPFIFIVIKTGISLITHTITKTKSLVKVENGKIVKIFAGKRKSDEK
jgi:hypothetical protein